MDHRLVVTATARRDLDALPPRVLAAVVAFLYGDLARTPRRVGKQLSRELAGSWSARRGPYRVVYDLEEPSHAVTVLRVSHRADVYRPR